MSSYIVADETVNKVVSFLANESYKSYSYALQPVRDIGYALHDEEECKRLGIDMRRLNEQSVMAQYGAKGECLRKPSHTFRRSLIGRIQAYKSLCCFLYQIEGEFAHSLLYKALASVKNRLAHDIVTSLAEYDAATWDG